MDPIVLYLGPSVINSAPIVVLATLDSRNRKTGPMIQTWIVPIDGPLDGMKTATDDSVCGDCPRRRSTGGDCYVRIDAAPHAAWKRWDRSGRPGQNWDHHVLKLAQEAQTHGLRLGAYGDPAAVASRARLAGSATAHAWIEVFNPRRFGLPNMARCPRRKRSDRPASG